MSLEKIPQKERQEKTPEELMASIEEEVGKKIKEEGVDANEIAGIAEDLKNEGKFNAGDELNEEAFRIYRKNLIERELKKRAEN